MKTFNNEDGMILLTVLILMFIATLLGVVSINSSTIEVQLAGNEKKVSTSFAAAEAGIDLGIVFLEETLNSKQWLGDVFLPYSGFEIDNDYLYYEISSPDYAYNEDTTATPDILIPDIGGRVKVAIDIDRLYAELIAGGALEFAMGYEGVGAGAAGGGVAVYYRINSAGGGR